jgi:hypothetical protein
VRRRHAALDGGLFDMAHTRPRLAGAALAGATAGAALLIGAPVISAPIISASAAAASAPDGPARVLASCSKKGCDNKDPVGTGCARGARSVAHQDTGMGRFELYWSPSCQTNWVQINNYKGGGDYLKFIVADLDRPFRGHVYTATTRAGLHYGDMVWSPGRNCAEGHADWKSNGHDDVVVKSSGC